MSTEDKYETLEKIGHGSFGIIRKVRRKTDGFIMCRKEISYLRMSQKEREQLHSEFQILSHLRHPNIVAYYHREHLKISQDLHLYMEYCGNGDLGRVIKDLALKGQRAQENFVWSIFSQLVMALYRCHYGSNPPDVGTNILGLTQGSINSPPKVPAGTMTILHRDLKPENVFLGEDNSVKLGDFGLSKMIKSHDFASTYVGTPFYMSPEICAAEKYTLKSDIWSLGCIIYELCAREPPFNAKTHYQLVQKIKDGKFPTLPDMYSPELNQVIKDCLRVNPDRRPDTAQLLNLPVVRLMRKEKEVADLSKSLKSREEAVRRKEKELEDKVNKLTEEKDVIREELDASLRREWEVKARLEIDRLANVEIEQLQKRYEDEVQARVGAEVQRRIAALPPPPPPSENHSTSFRSEYPQSSIGASGDEFPSTTDITDYSLDSPEPSRETKKTARTPFSRAQTMFAGHGTPMDIEMASPSPMAIASLSLSPRRKFTTKAPVHNAGNIFAANANKTDKDWDLTQNILLDSDDEDICPSPTRHIKSKKNPFTSKTRPDLARPDLSRHALSSQKTAPVSRIKPKASSSALATKAASAGATAQTNSAAPSPRHLTKIPSAANLQNDTTTITSSGGGLKSKLQSKKSSSSDSSDKAPSKNSSSNIRGRTLVELQQARAGGRPISAVFPASENPTPKRAFRDRIGLSRRSSGDEPVAVWDPEHDEMPSPFLVRQRRIAKA